MLKELEGQVRDLYLQADNAVDVYQLASGLACVSGCTNCCYSEKVEATVLEMIPAAFHLFNTNQAELLIKRLHQDESLQRCIFFRPDLCRPETGGCSQYSERALVCRLFGFAGSVDRNGQERLARCRHMEMSPKDDSIGLMPLFQTFGMALTALHPGFGTIRKPINRALYEALVKIGLYLEYSSPIEKQRSCDYSPDTPASTPPLPRRKAA